MSTILKAKSRAKRKLANAIKDKDKNIAIHCYYYSILLLLKAYLVKHDLMPDVDNSSSHIAVIKAFDSCGLFAKNYISYIYALKYARELADYNVYICYNDKQYYSKFVTIENKFNKLNTALQKLVI